MFNRRRIEGLTAAAPQVLGKVGLGRSQSGNGGAYGRVLGARVRNWASSAKAGAGADVLAKVELKDADGVIFYLDAADRDYATAAVNLNFVADDTATGLAITNVDSTGADVAAGEAAQTPVVRGPITVTIRNGATTTDFFTVDLLVEV